MLVENSGTKEVYKGVLPTCCSPFKKRNARAIENVDTSVNSRAIKIFNNNDEQNMQCEVRASDFFNFKIQDLLSIQCKQVMNQGLKIVESMEYSELLPNQKINVDNLIKDICNRDSFSNDDRFAELGILFYFVVSNKSLPVYLGSGLKNLRIKEIEAEIANLNHIHTTECPIEFQELIPSGCHAYTLRALIRMIFPSNGSFNLGGCQAVISLMNSCLLRAMTEESRLQIIKVVQHLMVDKSFQNYFLEPFEVDEQFQRLILSDMKLPRETPFSFIFVRWVFLKVLFNTICQGDNQPNCYAVATLLNLMNNQSTCKEILKILKSVLISGTIPIGKVQIPAMTLYKTRLIYDRDFDLKLKYDELKKLTIFSVVKDCLSHLQSSVDSECKANSIEASMKFEFGKDVEYAKELFFSFKHVFLQQLMLSIIQFYACNSMPLNSKETQLTLDTDVLERINSKEDLLYSLMRNSPSEHLHEKTDDIEGYKHLILEELSGHLFFVDYSNSKLKINKQKVMVEHHENGLIKNHPPSVYENFKPQRRLCYLHKGELLPIDTLSKFQEKILDFTDLVNIKHKLHLKPWMSTFLNFVRSKKFLSCVAGIVSKMNKDECILKAHDFLKSDSFFIIQNGGNIKCLHYFEPIGSLYEKPIKFRSKDAVDFSDQLIKHISNYVKSKFALQKPTDPWVIIESVGHVYNACISNMLDYVLVGGKTVSKNIIDAAEKNLTLNPNKIQRIFDRVFDQKRSNEKFSKYKNYRSITSLLKKVKAEVANKFSKLLDDSVQIVMSEIELSSVKTCLNDLLQKLIENENQRPNLDDFLIKLDLDFNNQYISPLLLAQKLGIALIDSSPSIFIPIDVIENHVRSHFGLPEVIKFANLNWQTSKRVIYLFLEYYFPENKVVLNKRSGSINEPFDLAEMAPALKKTALRFLK